MPGAQPDLIRQAEGLRSARLSKGWTQLRTASALTAAAQALRRERDLPPGGLTTLLAYISYFENGRRAVPSRLRPLFREVYRATDAELGLTSDRAPQPVPVLGPVLDVAAGPAVVDALHGMLTAGIEADMCVGPALLLPAIRSQLPMVERLCHAARGTGRDPVLRVGIHFHEFCGWLYQDSGDCQAAMITTDTALELAAELDDPQVTSYVLMRKSNIATDAGQPGRAAGLASAALTASSRLTPRLRAVALRQKANAHALVGEHEEFARARDAAHIQAAAGMAQHEPDNASYCTPSYVEMEAGAALVRLGRPALAIPIFEESRSRWPAGNQRDKLLCQARLATAYASAGEPAAACATGIQMLDPATGISSARVTAELARLSRHLAPWARNPDVADFRARLPASPRSSA